MAGIVRVFDNRPRGYVLDLADLSSNTFYPVTMSPPGGMNYSGLAGLDCEIHSPSYVAASAYNQNYITFRAQCDGWGDRKEMLTVREYGCYDANEITIGCIGFGSKDGPVCVWIRGGLEYGFYCNSIPELHTSAYTTSQGEIFTPGANFYGGTNTNVNIQWTPDGKTLNMSLTAWPIGSIFMSATHDTAAKVKAAVGGGTWEAWGQGRVPLGMGSNGTTNYTTVEATGGEEKHELTVAEMPSHNHPADLYLGWQTGGGSTVGRVTTNDGNLNGWTVTVKNTGGDQAHNNLQPYITVYMWKRTA